VNIDLKAFPILLSLTLILSVFFILNLQVIYSQSSEDAKSLNCKDNTDQSQYMMSTMSVNKSDGAGAGPVTDDLQGFH
jgi:hypothetical protein